MLILPVNARKFKECVAAGQLNQILAAIVRQNFKTTTIVNLGESLTLSSTFRIALMMTRDSIGTSNAAVEAIIAKKLSDNVAVERRPIGDAASDRTKLEDLSNFAFCPLSPGYFEFALNRGLRGQETTVFEVSSWNSGRSARFRVKS